jgi:hypothetical protein
MNTVSIGIARRIPTKVKLSPKTDQLLARNTS